MDSPSTFTSLDLELEHFRALAASLTNQLAEANDEIKEFTDSSRELQDELEKELGRLEAGEGEMRRRLEETRDEGEGWKMKYTTALREHTTTMTHMQRELESLRSSEQASRTKLRDMELDNDDLEKSEREKDSSLQDLENRYSRSIERTALLEEELVMKAQLEEEAQRLKDELRDLGEELSVLRSQAVAFPPTDPRPLTPPGILTLPPAPLIDPFPELTADEPTPLSPVTARYSPSSDKRGMSSRPSSSYIPVLASPHTPTAFVSQSNHLARSTKGRNLASAAVNTPPSYVTQTPTQRGGRDRKTDVAIADIRQMTDRVKRFTSRNLFSVAGGGSSGIPRASYSPQTLAAHRSTASIGKSSLGMSTSASSRGILGMSTSNRNSQYGAETYARPARSAGGSESATTSTTSTRPPSRSSMRMSIGGRSAIPVRPPSRLSSLSASTSRPETPVFARPPTPTSSRPAWGSNQPSQPTASTNVLGRSVRRRPSSTILNATTLPPPLPRPASAASKRGEVPEQVALGKTPSSLTLAPISDPSERDQPSSPPFLPLRLVLAASAHSRETTSILKLALPSKALRLTAHLPRSRPLPSMPPSPPPSALPVSPISPHHPAPILTPAQLRLPTSELYASPTPQKRKHYGPYAHVREKVDWGYHTIPTKERMQLQDCVVEGVLGRVASPLLGRVELPGMEGERKVERPLALFTAGGMGAGKGHALRHYLQKGIIALPSNCVLIDPDAIALLLPERQQYLDACPRMASKLLHPEASLLQEILMDVAKEERRSLVVDGSLSQCGWYAGVMKEFAKENYDIEILFVFADEPVMQARAKYRARKTGRVTDPESITRSRIRSPECVHRLARKQFVNRVRFVWNNDKHCPPQIVYDSSLDPAWAEDGVDAVGFVQGRLTQGKDGRVVSNESNQGKL